MIKKITAVLTAAIITICIAVPCFAEVNRDWQNKEIPTERQLARAVDYTGAFSDEQLEQLNEKLDKLSEKWNVDIACVLDKDLGEYSSATKYADDYYDYNGFAENGVLFAVFSDSRDWAVSTKGSAIKTFGDYRDSIVGTIKSELSDGNYFDAFTGYADKCDEMLAYESEHGSAYVASQQKDASDYIIAVVISVVVGIIIGFIGSGIMKSKLKSVDYKSGATDYIVPESFKLDNSRDVYLYNTITRTERESESSSSSGGGSHTSSSGSSHGGGSGKF